MPRATLPLCLLLGLLAACSDPASTAPASNATLPDASLAPDAAAPSDTPSTPDVAAPADASSAADTAADTAPLPDAAPDAAPADAPTADAGAVPSSPAVALLASADDAVASYLMDAAASAWNLFSGATVPLGRHSDAAHVSYHTALRFTGLQVPAGANIVSAKLRWYPTNEVDSSHPLWLNIYADKSPDSAPFDPANALSGRPDQRAHTAAHIDHYLVRCNDSCTDLSEYDCPQRKLDCWDRKVAFEVPKDLKALVQEVVDQPGWKAGAALTLLVVNAATEQDGKKYQDHRSITGFDPERGPAFSPQLTVVFGP